MICSKRAGPDRHHGSQRISIHFVRDPPP